MIAARADDEAKGVRAGVPGREAAEMKCERCRGQLGTTVRDFYQDDGLIGLSNVILVKSVKVTACEECGHEESVSVPDVEGLEAAVAVARVTLPIKLTGQEIRFLRRALGLLSKDLAEELQVREETMSRWEHDDSPINPKDEKLLRILVGQRLASKARGVRYDQDEIFRMRIPAVATTPREDFQMFFWRLPVIADREGVEAWTKRAA